MSDTALLQLQSQPRTQQIRELSIETADRNPIGPTRLGALMLDEILPVERGVSHELAFHGGRVRVLCADLNAVWSPPV